MIIFFDQFFISFKAPSYFLTQFSIFSQLITETIVVVIGQFVAEVLFGFEAVVEAEVGAFLSLGDQAKSEVLRLDGLHSLSYSLYLYLLMIIT